MSALDPDRFLLRTDRLLLRRIVSDDLPALYRLYSDPEVMAFASDPVFTSPGLMACFLASVERGYASGDYYEFAVVLPEVGPIGTCSLHSFSADRREAELGYLLRRDLWRRGLMSEAVARLLRWGAQALALQAVGAEVDAGNEASCRLLQRLGFVEQPDRTGCYRLVLAEPARSDR
ncbi:GNAT family N-acetyltransferase [Chitinimonas lacunae]|uniref:GNAT family N-acetyltransferase n=1 Tax=Chitinimonas lacunae TaxID=1963018 RepID=A0ABV8MTA1_9NEIS